MDQNQPTQKRSRAQLSCTHCRHSKLKCDRKEPCSQCVKKDRALLCFFPTPAARRKPALSMQSRLRHLESLVKDVMTGQGSTPPSDINYNGSSASPNTAGGQVDTDLSDPRSCPDSSTGESSGHPLSSGQVLMDTNESTYVGATHWAAILENIEEVKSYFERTEEEDAVNNEGVRRYATLTFNAASSTSHSELVAALPDRSVVDRLVSRYFNCNSPALHIIHKPTFQKEYQRFWADPERSLLSWLGFLYAVMTAASFSALSEGEEHPDSRGPVRDMIQSYRSGCIQCLVLSNYSKPGPYTIECLTVFMEGEFFLSKDNQVHFYLLVGNTVRLALRMGLHRDPSKVQSKLTIYQSEMRRRLWNHLVQIDLLSSFHIGLPGICPTIESDTLLPRNLRDEDFGEDSITLPQSRPDEELTPVTYAIFKGMLCKISGKITTLANRLEIPSYFEVMDLDRQLHAAYANMPSFLMQTDLSITDSPDLIIKRLSIALIFQKSRCVCHRRFLLKARDSPEFKYSGEAGLDSSLELLRYQVLIHNAVLPGGPLCRDRWFLSSLSMHDFLLAGMIVYLCLVQTFDRPVSGRSVGPLDGQQQKMLTSLKRSYDIWNQTDSISMETKKASGVLGVLLKKLDVDLGRSVGVENGAQVAPTSTMQDDRASIAALSLTDVSPSTAKSVDIDTSQESWATGILEPAVRDTDLEFSSELHSTFFPVESIWGMADFPDNFDWETFDNQLLPQQLMDVSWDTFNPEDILMVPEVDYNF